MDTIVWLLGKCQSEVGFKFETEKSRPEHTSVTEVGEHCCCQSVSLNPLPEQ